ncbi:YktB family protein [Sporosarcina sp. A2]|uniref:YktB family protein n=1 Tax=Sporosarcina sp. A2 TaxID=3393449 RepID=UPI003D7A8F2D
MTKTFWTDNDFSVFEVDGLDARMTALQERIQPKFSQLGNLFTPLLSAHGKGEFYPHVAKHARRTVNPPSDSWIAFAPAKRGYKALPHFQIGLWGTHLFIVLAVIYENPDKKGISERLQNNLSVLTSLPEDFVVSGDHMKPGAQPIQKIGDDGITPLLERLHDVKKAEFLVGRHLNRNQASELSEKDFLWFAEETFEKLLPVYDCVIG